MASENKRGNRETKKPKKVVSKTIAAAPSTKDMVSAAIKTAGKKTKERNSRFRPAPGSPGRSARRAAEKALALSSR